VQRGEALVEERARERKKKKKKLGGKVDEGTERRDSGKSSDTGENIRVRESGEYLMGVRGY
jgi:hypothetical protein